MGGDISVQSDPGRGSRFVFSILARAADDAPGLIRSLARAGGGGNVTVPHKAAVAALMDELSDAARAADAVNVVVRDGKTAGVVTSAALVMVAVFGSFALASDQLAKQIGVGLAAAILIDATLIRGVLLPASMKLLGERNWYLPSRLGWLPRFAHEPEAVPAPA